MRDPDRNLQVHTSGAEYRDPRIAEIIDVERELPVYNLRELVSRITSEINTILRILASR